MKGILPNDKKQQHARGMIKYFLTFCVAVLLLIAPVSAEEVSNSERKNFAYGNNFSCPFGKSGACLDHGDNVCSSFSKCVARDAVCFDSYTCDYQGFVCKAEYDGLVREYDDLVRKYNSVIDCVSYASSSEEAKYCF